MIRMIKIKLAELFEKIKEIVDEIAEIEEEKKDKNKENICSQYCEKVKKLITDNETQIKCANEIMRDESFIQILSNLNNHTPQVINK